MNIFKTFASLLFLVSFAFLCGCSQSNEDEVRKAKRFEALKVLPLDTILSRAYKFYEQFQATNDTLLRDSMNDYRDHFFARWKWSSDSLCKMVAPDDSLAAELREIYKVVMEFYTKYHYWLLRDKAQREFLEKKGWEENPDSMRAVREKQNSIKKAMIQDMRNDPVARKKRRKENKDSIRVAQEKKDSIENMAIMGIPIEEAASGLKENPNSMYESVYNSAYFVQATGVFYVDTSASDVNELDNIDRRRIKRDEWKKANVACLDRTPAGQQVLVINKEYGTLLNDFMKTNVHVSYRERYSDTFFLGKYPFWYPVISVVPHHWGDGFHFDSFPSILQAVFNKTHDTVMLNVMESFSSGGYYYLSKKNGKWKFVKYRYGWIM